MSVVSDGGRHDWRGTCSGRFLVGEAEKSSHADASSERETMGMRREGRG
jgi:hypothetical protein